MMSARYRGLRERSPQDELPVKKQELPLTDGGRESPVRMLGILDQ